MFLPVLHPYFSVHCLSHWLEKRVKNAASGIQIQHSPAESGGGKYGRSDGEERRRELRYEVLPLAAQRKLSLHHFGTEANT